MESGNRSRPGSWRDSHARKDRRSSELGRARRGRGSLGIGGFRVGQQFQKFVLRQHGVGPCAFLCRAVLPEPTRRLNPVRKSRVAGCARHASGDCMPTLRMGARLFGVRHSRSRLQAEAGQMSRDRFVGNLNIRSRENPLKSLSRKDACKKINRRPKMTFRSTKTGQTPQQ